MHVEPQRKRRCDPDDEVPIGRVGRDNDDDFGEVGQSGFDLPADQPEDSPAQGPLEPASAAGHPGPQRSLRSGHESFHAAKDGAGACRRIVSSIMHNPAPPSCLGIIGGSGVYDIEWLEHPQWVSVEGPFGRPSDDLLVGELDGMRLVFLPRHGRGHRIPPSEVNFRANLDALKRAGVTDVLALSAVGSLREDLAPGTFVIVDQFIDRTFARTKTFFGTGLVGHVSMAEPVCARLGDVAEAAARETGVPCVRGGTYVVMEGPQFSTRAESDLYRKWGAAVIGMTNMPEAKLAREAELCYATVAMVTDWDCWHATHGAVTVEQVMAVMGKNVVAARELVRLAAPRLRQRPAVCPHGCDRVLDGAIMTAPAMRDPALAARLSVVAGRVL
jgi:5'-methylthioadenosine phosphorylase